MDDHPAGIETILAQIRPALRGHASRLSSQSSTRQDTLDELTSRVALALVQRQDKGRVNSAPIGLGVVKHVAADMAREMAKYQSRHEADPDLHSLPCCRTKSPLEEAEQAERCPLLNEVVRRWRITLRPQERRVLRRLRKGMTHAQAASRESVATGTVSAWVHRSRRRLEEMLK